MQAACLLRYHMRWRNRHYLNNFCRNSMAFIFLVVPAMCSRTYMVKTAMSLTPIPGVIF
ncbi:gamma-glutamyl-GABA hydrolase [Escherichia coli 8.0566]|nr:gamma-glutamyl-GABA hydrolase [Escherichia coli 8.0566]EYD89139.1 putative gamma-glutamyl-GABA hydrolase [Escherichia coli 1-176-05_S1_C1]